MSGSIFQTRCCWCARIGDNTLPKQAFKQVAPAPCWKWIAYQQKLHLSTGGLEFRYIHRYIFNFIATITKSKLPHQWTGGLIRNDILISSISEDHCGHVYQFHVEVETTQMSVGHYYFNWTKPYFWPKCSILSYLKLKIMLMAFNYYILMIHKVCNLMFLEKITSKHFL